ncbi:sensor domain-containing diguanylate cyclase [Piscinibacter sakaiensis]|uniref:Uncharacterized protein n=1 Tax=Piscinibacter sakaiensis TaxID=1547922 RepID=A0A0K8NTN2_PISS1|nr:PAS domain-containing protein [Piscinibacter sakaiensis]GAP33771.1 hypothetical protein ISF6_1026 [Piscinibacter sakaiensis]
MPPFDASVIPTVADDPSLPPRPADEARRLQALRALMVLDSAPEPLFDQIAQLAASLCQVPMALLNLVDAERQWTKAVTGADGMPDLPRRESFCAHAITQADVLEVPDTRLDPRFRHNPLVTGDARVVFYAGAPVVLPDGEAVGTLCVVDQQVRRLTPALREQLRQLAGIAARALVMRRELVEGALSARSHYERVLARSEEHYRGIVEQQHELVSLARRDGELVYVNPAYARHFGRTPEALAGTSLYALVEPADRDAVHALVGRVFDTDAIVSGENRMVSADGTERWVAWTNRVQRDEHGEPLLHSVGRDISERKRAEDTLRASQAFLERTGRVARVGGWELDLRSGRLDWSAETRRIHEVPDDYQPALETALGFFVGDARARIDEAVQRALRHGTPWDLELPLVTATGRQAWVHVVGELQREDGRAVRMIGAMQDVTERRQLQLRLADSERFVRQITNHLPVRITYVDAQRRYRFVNDAMCRRFGRPREAILGRTRAELLGDGDSALLQAHVGLALAGTEQQFEFDDRIDGELRRMQSQLVPDRGPDGEVRGYFGIGVDITDATAAREALLRQSATLRSVTEAIPALVAVIGADLRYRFVNSAFERWFGRDRGEIVDQPTRSILGDEESDASRPWALRALAGETVSFERADGHGPTVRHLAITYIPLRLPDGSVDGFVSVAQDISSHKREENRLLQLSRRDPLTGLLNRAGFEDWLGRLLQRDGAGAHLALLYLDLDHFKPVNDQHGHAVGDEVLRMFAQRVAKIVRPSDAVARLGGDEFAIALAGVRHPVDTQRVADQVIAAARAPFNVDGLRLRIGTSVGLAHGAPDGDWRGLVARADAMLYRAKAEGRGRLAGLEPRTPDEPTA